MLVEIMLQCRLVRVFGHLEIEAGFFATPYMDPTAVLASPSSLRSQMEQAMHGYVPTAMLALNGLATRSWLHGV
jgi:hypothetical protein